jgi:hypothetical protein
MNIYRRRMSEVSKTDTTKYEMLYKLIEGNTGRKWRDIPYELESKFNSAKSDINSLHGDDILKGMLGYYMKSKLPKSISIGSDSISYSPNKNSSYGIKMENGNPTFKGSWRF